MTDVGFKTWKDAELNSTFLIFSHKFCVIYNLYEWYVHKSFGEDTIESFVYKEESYKLYL